MKYKYYTKIECPEVKVMDYSIVGQGDPSDIEVVLQVGDSIITVLVPHPDPKVSGSYLSGVYKDPTNSYGLNMVMQGHYT